MSETLTLPEKLTLARYRIVLTPDAPLPIQGNLGAMLRGGLGFLLKEGACLRPNGALCQNRCQAQEACSYAYLFEGSPPPQAEVLRTHEAIPQPFVLAPPLTHADTVERGAPLPFQLTLFGHAIWHFPYLLAAFRALAWRGMGSTRVRARLTEATALCPDAVTLPLLDPSSGHLVGNQPQPAPVRQWAAGSEAAVHEARVYFVSPLRIKFDDRFLHSPPPFHVLVRTLLRRVSSLSAFHAGERWEIDYRGWIERAETVQMVAADAHWRNWERYSTRQERRMNLGGVVGAVTYAGEITPFLPLLRLGELIHVGKGTVFGNGRYVLERDPNAE